MWSVGWRSSRTASAERVAQLHFEIKLLGPFVPYILISICLYACYLIYVFNLTYSVVPAARLRVYQRNLASHEVWIY